MAPTTRSKARREVVYLSLKELHEQHRAREELVKNRSPWAQAARPLNHGEDDAKIQFRVSAGDETSMTDSMSLAEAKDLGGHIAVCSEYVHKALGPGFGIDFSDHHWEAFQLYAAIRSMGSANIISTTNGTFASTTQLMEAALMSNKNGTYTTTGLIIEHLRSRRNEAKLFKRNDLITLVDPEGPFRQFYELRDVAVRWWAADVHEAQVEQWSIWSPELVAQGRQFMSGTFKTRAAKMEHLLGSKVRTPPASPE
ncbi:hypothetical protein BDZ85DRAFT_281687 [Elsinoe ampelina]|uniref:Uncharacterized protein n=1 Tax=Elsinoe ampelina TaxID=302913 RepID=A0A6A6GDT4_9PEZI|nr:hypothetical protein BDZ85DRAFT_281687 [Elsinoe ampelina]